MKKIYDYISFIYYLILDKLAKCRLLTKCKVLGICVGKNLVVKGYPDFYRGDASSLTIGDNCVFYSRETSNKMGLNHRCIVCTSHDAGLNAKLSIGNNCGFSGCSIWCFKSITIGNNVRVGANTMILDGDAHFNDSRTPPPQDIVIEDNVFIGANCIIRKGVTIGENSVIGMGSMVLHDIPANAVAVGNPAKVIRIQEK